MHPATDDTGSADLAALLLLVDGRFPSGAHAHSGTFEATAALERLADVATTERFLTGRLHTVGLVAAAFAAATCAALPRFADGCVEPGAAALMRLDQLDAELTARTASPALRATSRRLARQLMRAGQRIWPHPGLDRLAATGAARYQPMALGAVAAAAGLGPQAAALAAAHDSVVSPATAAVRLLGLDPFAVHAALARLSVGIGAVAAHAAGLAHVPPADLPALTAPLLDVAAEWHSAWEVRLFAS